MTCRQKPPQQRAGQAQVILSRIRGWILTEALRHTDHQHPTGSPNSKILESMGRTHQKGEGWSFSVPSTTGRLTHILLSQPAKGSLQLDTDREATQPGKQPSEPVTEQLGRTGGGEAREAAGPTVPAPAPLPLATLAPHKSLGIEVGGRLGGVTRGQGENTQGQPNRTQED